MSLRDPESSLPAQAWVVVAGLVFATYTMVTALVPRAAMPRWVFFAFAGLLLGGAFALAGVVLHRTEAKHKAGRTVPDEGARLRVAGGEAARARALGEPGAFEPVVLRSYYGLEVELKTPAPKGASQPEAETKTIGGEWHWSTIVCFALALGGMLLLYYFREGTVVRFQRDWERVLGAAAVGLTLAALVRPVYVRIAPGVLDVFVYGPLGMGKPRVERYDLRRARVLVDAEADTVRVEVGERATARTIYLHGRLLRGGGPTGPWVLAGAASAAETPALPTDSLS
jgi:hypothetical protein